MSDEKAKNSLVFCIFTDKYENCLVACNFEGGNYSFVMKLLELDRYLPYRMNVVAAMLSDLFEKTVLIPARISYPQWRILAILGSEGPSAQQNFIRRTRMDKITISRAVSVLTEQGAVTSTVSTADRRARTLELTPEGQKLFKRLADEALSIETQAIALSGMQNSERFLDELDRLESAVRTLGCATNGEEKPMRLT